MTDDGPGPLLASGRAADVYDLGDGTVLRRYRDGGHDVEREAEVMRWVAERGVPVPRVDDASGRDIVMERIDGRTMFEELEASPRRALRIGRALAHLQARLAEVPSPDWLMAPGFAPEPGGDRVLHLDLHPMNVILSPNGPVLIDWANAAGGPAGFDAALSYVTMATFGTTDRTQELVRRAVVWAFRRARGRAVLDPYVAVACDHRLADPRLTPDERVAVAEYRRQVRDRGAG
jgi:aminoglycoside phosphotransferase (APT) family kinase protein